MNKARSWILASLALFGSPALGQGVLLSDLSAWQPGTNLHLGVSTADKRFDNCYLYFGSPGTPWQFQGVDVVLDPRRPTVPVAATPQPGANSSADRSDEFKFYFNLPLHPALPVGAGIAIQAILLDSTNPRRIALSNGIVRSLAPVAPTEVRYGVYNYSGGLAFVGVDVDRLQVTSSWTKSPPGGAANYGGPPVVSPDGRWAALPAAGRTYLLDLLSGTGCWLPEPTRGNARFARFHPSDSSTLWVLEEWVDCFNAGGNWDSEGQLLAYDLSVPGFPIDPSRTVVLNDDPGCDPTVYHASVNASWSFDRSGANAYFLTRQRAGGGAELRLLACPAIGGVVQAPTTSWSLHPSATTAWLSSNNSRDLVPFGPTGMLAMYQPFATATAELVGVDFFRGVGPTQPLLGSGTLQELYPDAVASDGTYALVFDKDRFPPYRVLDGSTSMVSGAPLPELPSVGVSSAFRIRRAAIPIHGDVIVYSAQSTTSPIQKLTRGIGGIEVENVDRAFSTVGGLSAILPKQLNNTVALGDGRGDFTALRTRNGLLTVHTGQGKHHLVLTDTDTMTYCGSVEIGGQFAAPHFLF